MVVGGDRGCGGWALTLAAVGPFGGGGAAGAWRVLLLLLLLVVVEGAPGRRAARSSGGSGLGVRGWGSLADDAHMWNITSSGSMQE